MKKKIFAALLSVAMVASLCACGLKAPAEAPAEEKKVEEAPAAEEKAEEPAAEEPAVEAVTLVYAEVNPLDYKV